jgi:hypothetical protein
MFKFDSCDLQVAHRPSGASILSLTKIVSRLDKSESALLAC